MAELMYSEKDIKVIKEKFAENDALLKIVRKLFFGADISEAEKKTIVDSFDDETIEVLRRKIYSTKSFEVPIGQVSDFWLGVETQIFGASRDTIVQSIESKAKVEKMFKTAFDLLKNPDGEKVSLEYKPEVSLLSDPLQTSLIARNLYMKAIETALFTVKTIAGQKDETPEQALKRLKQDSAK